MEIPKHLAKILDNVALWQLSIGAAQTIKALIDNTHIPNDADVWIGGAVAVYVALEGLAFIVLYYAEQAGE